MKNNKVLGAILAASCFCGASAWAGVAVLPCAGAAAAARSVSLGRLEAAANRLADVSGGDAVGAEVLLDGMYSGAGSAGGVPSPAGNVSVTLSNSAPREPAAALGAAGGAAADTPKPDTAVVILPAAPNKKKDDPGPTFGAQLLAGGIGMLIAVMFVLVLL